MANAVVTLISSKSDRLTEMVFLQTKVTHFETMMKSTVIKQRYPMNVFFVVVCLIVLLLSSMSELIHNR